MSPDQYEAAPPGGVQAHEHVLRFDLMGIDARVALALTPALEVEVRVPFRWAFIEARFLDDEGQQLTDFTSIHHRTETISGVGDIGLEWRYRILGGGHPVSWRWDIVLGLTFPTGGIEPDPFELGRQKRVHQHLFFGTGTVNPVASLEVEKSFRHLSVQALSRWEGALYSNRYGYTGPKTLTMNADILSALGTARWQLKMGCEFMKQWPARWSSQLAENSGRMEVGPTLGAAWSPDTRLNIYSLFRRPFVVAARGTSTRCSPRCHVRIKLWV